MKFLLIWDYLIENNGTIQNRHPTQTVELFKQLVINGNNVTWIMPSTKNDHFKWKGITIHTYKKSKIYIITFLRKIKKIIQIIKYYNHNILYIRNNIINCIIGIIIKQIKKSHLIFRLTYPIPLGLQMEAKINHYILSSIYYIISIVWINLLKYLSNSIDLLIPMSNTMKKYLTYYNIPIKKMYTLSAGINPIHFSTYSNDNKIKNKYSLHDFKTIMYVGIIHPLRKLDIIINSFIICKKHIKNIKLLMIGHGKDRKRLERIIKQDKIEDIIFTGFIPYNDIPKYIAASDICLSTIPENLLFSLSSPSKIIEYLAMSKPVIASPIPEQKNIINNSKGGILVNNNEYDIAKAMIFLLENPIESNIMGINGHLYVLKNKTFDKKTKEFEEFLNKHIIT